VLIDHDYIVALVAERMTGDPVPTGRLADEVATIIEASGDEVDVPQLLRRNVRYVIREQARRQKAGVRASEITTLSSGERAYTSRAQLTISGLMEAGQEKVRHGDASRTSGLADITVASEAQVVAAQRGLDIAGTLVDDVLSADRQREIRDEILGDTNHDEAAA
jgi:hypothetical protein